MQTIVVKNRREAPGGCVRLIKVDCCDRSRCLAGARFDLLAAGPCGWYRPCRRGLETDRQGVLRVERLPPGRYRFVETAPPQGYRISGDGRVDFRVDARDAGACPVLVVGNQRACRPCRCCCCRLGSGCCRPSCKGRCCAGLCGFCRR